MALKVAKPKSKSQSKSNPEFYSFVASCIVHSTIFASILYVGHRNEMTIIQKDEVRSGEVKIPVQAAAPIGGSFYNTGAAFSGRALDVPVTQEEVSTHTVKKLQNLASALSRLHNLGLGMGGSVKNSQTRIDSKSIDQALATANQALLGAASRGGGGNASQSLLVATSGEKTRVIDAKEEARVRAIMESLQSKLSAAYDRAQKTDPSLSLALTYSGVVDGSGHLTRIKFQAKGEYTPSGLQILEQQVGGVLSSADLGRNLTGITIRGERLFVQ